MAKRGGRWILPLVIALVLAAAGGFLLLGNPGGKDQSRRYRTSKVERGEIKSIVTATGTINPVTTVLVGSQISGTIKSLYADYNSQVKEGQVIAQIDPAVLEAQVE